MAFIKDTFLNPLTDFGFKKLFGAEPNKEILIAFLNQVLPAKHRIQDLTYTQTEHVGRSEVDRKAIFDLACISEKGERFIVELQKVKQNWFKDRSVYYASFPVQEQALKGDWDYKLDPVYSIGILDFVFDETRDDTDYLHIVELKDQNCNVFYDKLKFIYLELPKFKKEEFELETDFDKWLYLFQNMSSLSTVPERLREGIFERVFEVAQIANFSEAERNTYEASLKAYRDLDNSFKTAREEAKREGREEGIEEGKKEQAFAVARVMKKNEESVEKIIQYTGLTAEEIENL